MVQGRTKEKVKVEVRRCDMNGKVKERKRIREEKSLKLRLNKAAGS
jgi:hypothetical protein